MTVSGELTTTHKEAVAPYFNYLC